MRKVVLTLGTICLLSLGVAAAQDAVVIAEPDLGFTTQYVGGSVGFPGLQFYYHSEDMDFVGGNSDVRFRLSIMPFFGFGILGGADVLFDVGQFGDAEEITVYAGGGPAVGFLTAAGVGGFTVDVTGLIGVDYRMSQDISLFAEGGAGFGYWAVSGLGGGFTPAFRSGVGLNYHF